jgi:hypothetical protein
VFVVLCCSYKTVKTKYPAAVKAVKAVVPEVAIRLRQ